MLTAYIFLVAESSQPPELQNQSRENRPKTTHKSAQKSITQWSRVFFSVASFKYL
jgi:hypothetical protein